MKNLRIFLVACLVLTLLVLAPVRAEEPAAKDILTQIPKEALGAVVVRQAGEFDQELLGFYQRLNLPPMSGLAMAKGMLGLLSGVDDKGSIAVVMMPIMDFTDPSQGLAVFVPAADYDALIAQLVPEAVEGETLLKKVMLADQTSYAGHRGGFAVFSPSLATLKILVAETESPAPGIKSIWTEHQLQRYGIDDVTAWINLQAVVTHPMVAGMLQMYAGMSGGAIDMQEINALRGLTISLNLANTGMHLGVCSSVDPNSARGKVLATSPVSDKTFLTGLPGDDYALAMGMATSEQEAQATSDSFGKLLANPMVAMQMDPQQLQAVSALLTSMIADMRGVAFSLAPLPESPNGLIGATKVVSVVSGAKNKCQKLAELFGLIPNLVREPEVQEQIRSALTYTVAAETIGDTPVDHLSLAVEKMPDVTEDDLSTMRRVVGKEGILFRLAAADDSHMVMSFGGGADRMAKVIELVRSGSAPLASDEGIKKSASTLRKNRSIEGYLALDNCFKGAAAIAKATGEAPPFPAPDVNAPIAAVMGPVGQGEFQIDLVVPMELIVAAKDVALSMHGGAPPPGEPSEPM